MRWLRVHWLKPTELSAPDAAIAEAHFLTGLWDTTVWHLRAAPLCVRDLRSRRITITPALEANEKSALSKDRRMILMYSNFRSAASKSSSLFYPAKFIL